MLLAPPSFYHREESCDIGQRALSKRPNCCAIIHIGKLVVKVHREHLAAIWARESRRRLRQVRLGWLPGAWPFAATPRFCVTFEEDSDAPSRPKNVASSAFVVEHVELDDDDGDESIY